MKALFAATVFFLVSLCVFISLTIPVGYWILPARVVKLGVVCKKFKQFLKYSRGLFVWKKLNLYLFLFAVLESVIKKILLVMEFWKKISNKEQQLAQIAIMFFFGQNNERMDERHSIIDLINSDNFCQNDQKFYILNLYKFQYLMKTIQNCLKVLRF